MRALLVLGVCALAACASSSSGNTCDPTKGPCDVVDAPTSTLDDAAAPIDVVDAPNKGFGEPCTDGDQCASDICILVPTGGVCSMTCGTCPDGYGCFGVLGAIEPDQVSYVCVPITSQLCSPCTLDTECTQIGMDRCLTEATGRSYCARDCSTVSCPSGYDCVDTQIGPSIYKECVPHSGACDCNTATQNGATDACSITTPLGTACAGTTTCGGTSGWGACQPPSQMDAPDAAYGDENCDGIDGDITKGIFVAGGGANTGTCGLTYQTPCQTISFGIVRGVQESRPNVYVQAGTYSEVVVLQSGVNVWGGYDFTWQRGPYSNPANRVTVVGKQDTTTGGDGEYMVVRAHDLIVPVMMADLVLQAPNAQGVGGTSGLDGRSSYVVHAKAATVALARVQLVAGAGVAGVGGSNGLDATSVDASTAMTGKIGGAGAERTDCDSSSRGSGGVAGTNSCSSSPSSRLMDGGAGGRGGTMDTNCNVFSLNLNARAGDNGVDALQVFGSNGVHGNGGSGGGSCGPTTGGNGGRIANGGAGGAGSGGYLGGTNNLYWYGRAGGSGGTGENGTGGGGGGGGGGCDSGQDAYGAGGGGGGAGGCAARGGGGGGGGGGGSFGIAAVGSSSISIGTCELFRAVAGSGGNGGTGGRGQSGGGGGPAANHPGSATPGLGGAGSHGGHGGGGAGGQGGRAVGLLRTNDSTITGTCTQSQGTAGSGGGGGASAPSAPTPERDGSAGPNGSAGTVEDARTCASSTSC